MDDFATLFMEVIPEAMNLLRSQARQEAKEFLTIPQFRTLAKIHRGISSIGEIAQELGVSQPAMSKMAEALEQKGLIKREIHPSDRRSHILKLTEEGKAIFQKIKRRTRKKLRSLIEEYSGSEENLNQSLKELAAFASEIKSQL